ncbi:winged helix-turn-helix transcriptional regulator [bacterium]|nr:winged helix-turn-helix transcriptional regulator [bacterium]
MATPSVFPTDLLALADTAKALAHPARLRILQILAATPGCMCGDIVEQLPLAQATVSQHLKELRRVGLIQGEISGPRRCYCIDPVVLERAVAAFTTLLGAMSPCTLRGENDDPETGCC